MKLRWLLPLFLLMPLIELSLLLLLAQLAGHWWVSVLLVIITGTLGAVLGRRQGLGVWRRGIEAVRSGKLPTDELLDGALILVAALLLLTPGPITDAIGLSLLIPPIRRPLRRRLAGWLKRRFSLEVIGGQAASSFTTFAAFGTPGRGPVFDVEARRADPADPPSGQ